MQVEGCTILGKRRDFKAESICSIDGTRGESEVTVDGEKRYRQMGDLGTDVRRIVAVPGLRMGGMVRGIPVLVPWLEGYLIHWKDAEKISRCAS